MVAAPFVIKDVDLAPCLGACLTDFDQPTGSGVEVLLLTPMPSGPILEIEAGQPCWSLWPFKVHEEQTCLTHAP